MDLDLPINPADLSYLNEDVHVECLQVTTTIRHYKEVQGSHSINYKSNSYVVDGVGFDPLHPLQSNRRGALLSHQDKQA
jgi:hypothetical protein